MKKLINISLAFKIVIMSAMVTIIAPNVTGSAGQNTPQSFLGYCANKMQQFGTAIKLSIGQSSNDLYGTTGITVQNELLNR